MTEKEKNELRARILEDVTQASKDARFTGEGEFDAEEFERRLFIQIDRLRKA